MKTTVAVFFGGRSVEHEISVISANQALWALDQEKYTIVPVYISKEGAFYTGDLLFDILAYAKLDDLLRRLEEVSFVREKDGVYMVSRKKKWHKTHLRLDVAIPVVHGTNVEDGTLQGFLELLGLPYAGCDVASSALGMDKAAMKYVLKNAGVPVLDCLCFYKDAYYKEAEQWIQKIEETIGYPVIVKPYNTGSSVGIKVAHDRPALKEAIEYAADFSERVLTEHAISKLREINCSVLGDHSKALASVLEEPFSSDEILSYQDKYMGGGGTKGTKGAKGAKSGQKGMSASKKKLPADLPPEHTKLIQDLATRTFLALGCSGVSRIDFMIDEEENKTYVNEINTIPGSLSFYLWEASGLSFPALMDELVRLALKRERERGLLSFSFDTNILQNIGKTGLNGGKGSKS